MKKIILTVFAASSLLLYSTPSFAISLSVGVPIGASIKGDDGSEVAVELVDISLVYNCLLA